MDRRQDPLLLLASAAIAVTVMLWASSLPEEGIEAFAEASPGDRVTIGCLLTDRQATSDGYVVTLIDPQGGEMRGFTRERPREGAVRVSGTVSSDGGMLFIEELLPIGQTY